MRWRLLCSLLLILGAVGMYFSPTLYLPGLDPRADAYFSRAMKEAGVSYAVARGINAALSVVKESELGLEPFGVGLSLAVGQVLDPLDDMVERLSTVLVTAVVALGVQKLVYEISGSLFPDLMLVWAAAALFVLWLPEGRRRPLGMLLKRLLILLVAARCFLPVSACINSYLDQNFFAERIEDAKNRLSLASEEIAVFSEIELPEVDGIRGTLANGSAFVGDKFTEFKAVLSSLKDKLGPIAMTMLELCALYVGVIFVEVVALPLLMFWLLNRLGHRLVATGLPTPPQLPPPAAKAELV